MTERQGRAFWEGTINEFMASGLAHKEFAALKGVKLYTFQSWLYRLRRERSSRPQRLLPVRVAPAPAAGPLVLEADGITLRFGVGTDVDYVARLVAALDRSPC